jgi:LPXTG-motif cell wall-anchored protein
MEIIAQTNVYEQPQAYYRMPQGDRLQDDLDYGINGSVSTNNETKDSNYLWFGIIGLAIAGFIIYKKIYKK